MEAVTKLMADEFARQDAIRNLQQFEVLGMVDAILFGAVGPDGLLGGGIAGSLRFDKNERPGFGRDTVGGLLWLSDFPVLPARHAASEEFCSACLAKCRDCKGKGTMQCVYPGCGGRGQVQAGEGPCSCVRPFTDAVGQLLKPGDLEFAKKMVAARDACKLCNGYGAQPKLSDCPACGGKKKAPCNLCRGTGKMPTGFAGGEIKADEGPGGQAINAKGKVLQQCAECHGTMRAGKWAPQLPSKFVMGKFGDYFVLGPVVALDLIPPASGGGRFEGRFNPGEAPAKLPGLLRLHTPPDMNAVPLMIAVQDATALGRIPCRVWFFGGAKFDVPAASEGAA